MSSNFGYIDIILLAMIAGFIILRLRSILGRKTGHEDKIYPRFAEKKFEEFRKQQDVKFKKKVLIYNLSSKKDLILYSVSIQFSAKEQEKGKR